MAMILSAGLMLRHLKKDPDADRLERAVAQVLASGKARSADLKPLGPPARTPEIADAIITAIGQAS
jgi:isocitrate/isopropylmalate dehydrogenase